MEEDEMRYKTTVNVRIDILERIEKASETLGISKNSVVSILLNRVRGRAVSADPPWGLVKYQDRCPKEMWKKLHVRPEVGENEYSGDLRKILKFSVSYLVAQAVVLYLDSIIENWNKERDNYPDNNYMKSNFCIDSVPCWIYYWGIPTRIIEQPG